MAATGTPTPNIGLRRAQGTDPASVDDINYNSALIDTKLGAVGNSSVQDQIDTLNSNITQLTPTILYNNNNPSGEGDSSKQLSEDISHFSFYEIIFKATSSSTNFMSTGKIPVGKITMLENMYSGYMRGRDITAISGTTLSYSNGYYYNSYPGTKTNDIDSCLISKVIGYKV